MKVLITGDFCPNDRVEKLVTEGKVSEIFNDFASYILSADWAITNLEAPLTCISEKIEKSGPCLKAPQKSANILFNAGFRTVTLANNHIMDYGSEGLCDTILACKKSGISYVGAGENQEDISRYIVNKVGDIKVAIVNFCENEFSTITKDGYGANPIDPVQNFYQIKKAKQEADFVIVITHAGHEQYQLPSPRMKSLFRYYIDLGADVVVNHHTHCISGYEVYNNSPIFYSLGNFSFDWNNKRNSLWNNGIAVIFNFKKDEDVCYEIVPFRQGDTLAGVVCLNDEESKQFYLEQDELNNLISNDEAIRKKFNDFAVKQYASVLLPLEPYSNRVLKSLKYRGLLPSFLSRKQKLIILNHIRCESHRDIITMALEN